MFISLRAWLVPEAGLEPACLAAADFESSRISAGNGEIANFATRTDRKHVENLWQAGIEENKGSKMENPGALAGATGAKVHGTQFSSDLTQVSDSVARVFVYAILALPRDHRIPALEHALEALRPGAPVPALLNWMQEARDDARFASISECKARALAYAERLPEADRRAFALHIMKGLTNAD